MGAAFQAKPHQTLGSLTNTSDARDGVGADVSLTLWDLLCHKHKQSELTILSVLMLFLWWRSALRENFAPAEQKWAEQNRNCVILRLWNDLGCSIL